MRQDLAADLTWSSIELDIRSPVVHEDTSHGWTDGKPRVCDRNTSDFSIQGALGTPIQIVGVVKTSKLLERDRHPFLLVPRNGFREGNPIIEPQLGPYAIEWDAWQLLHDDILGPYGVFFRLGAPRIDLRDWV